MKLNSCPALFRIIFISAGRRGARTWKMTGCVWSEIQMCYINNWLYIWPESCQGLAEMPSLPAGRRLTPHLNGRNVTPFSHQDHAGPRQAEPCLKWASTDWVMYQLCAVCSDFRLNVCRVAPAVNRGNCGQDSVDMLFLALTFPC